MVSKKPTKPPAPTANHSAHLSSKLSTASNALLTSAFSPSHLQLGLFASTIVGLDAHRLRIHDITTGRLRCEFTLKKGVAVNSLAWGTVPSVDDQKDGKKKKKRKRLENGHDTTAAAQVIVAAATSEGVIRLFSPSEGTLWGMLEGGHIGEVRQFVFSSREEHEGRGWSVGVDGKLVEWDVRRKIALRTISLPDPAIQRLAYAPPAVLCASHTVYAIDYSNPGMSSPTTFTANTTPIHTILTSKDNSHFLTAADSDRFINAFSISNKTHIHALVAESDVKSISVRYGGAVDILVAVTIDGEVELFKTPFDPVPTVESPAAGRKRKALTRKGDARVRVVRPGSRENVSIADASLQDGELVVAWVESGVNMEFEKIKWMNPENESLVLSGLVEITRSKSAGIGSSAGGAVINGAKDMGKSTVDQSHTVVIGGADTQDIGMEDAADNDEASAAEEPSEDEAAAESDDDSDASEKEPEEPSFAEKFQALEVSAKSAASTASTALTKPQDSSRKQLAAPSAGSLTTVLTQALASDDKTLLESCLHTTDSNAILATVRRLNSTMAVTLLERLAERIARRPGRAGSLGIWVRWTLVAHGGYLVTLPDLMSTLSGLHSTLNTRAGALPRLLALQGRLDMLHAQVDLRNTLRGGVNAKEADEEREKGVLYIEGQDEQSSDESDKEPEEVGMQGLQIEDASYIGGGASSDEDMVNGVSGDEDDDDDDDDELDTDEEDEDGMGAFIDIEASEASTDNDEEEEEEDEDEEGEGDSIDYDDVDGASEDDEAVIKKIRDKKAASRAKARR